MLKVLRIFNQLKLKNNERYTIMRVQISTILRKGIKDVEGDTILRKLQENGFDISTCNVGQTFYVELDPTNVDIEQMCDILVNDLLYDYKVEKIDA